MAKLNIGQGKRKRLIATYWQESLFVFITAGLLLWRITISATPYDEVINVSLAYRLSLGQLPFYEAQEAFQTGAIILAPFLWLYTTVIGSTDGIILFSRFLYLAALAALGMLTFRVFKKIVPFRVAFYMGYLCIFFKYTPFIIFGMTACWSFF